ncbi:hypothetical protein PSTT_05486 [Puccinia striiformis]|uniref:1,3-beta-glucan synthase n=1 Tax=Puccinia striiformis TaxID=27350 RepID=A0A2S4VNT8_9BASI|nr:hypothetical protein PSTT_05486 [Puccinia striiformis]
MESNQARSYDNRTAQTPSTESLMGPTNPSSTRNQEPISGSSTPTAYDSYGYPSGASTGPDPYSRLREAYPAWSSDSQIPLSKEEIEDVFIDLANKFGFQRDSMRNVYDHLMIQLDSRASRMSPSQALLTLHADYIGGEHANYRKWYFAAQLDLDDAIGQTSNAVLGTAATSLKSASAKSLESARNRWRQAMSNMSSYDRMRQLALYLLCWGEAAQVRFMPECLCFIFKCADDYYRSSECQNRIEPVPEGLYLRAVIRPLYRFFRDQGYELIDGVYLRIAKITLNDRTRLIDIPLAQRYMKFDKIEWRQAFFKTYLEKRSFGHMIVNFNRIWVLHISVYWYFTAYNAPAIYTLPNQRAPAKAMQWSAVALGGAVSTLIMIAATIIEFSYVPTTWNNTSHLARRGTFLLLTLALTAGPTIYIAGFDRDSSTAYILAMVQFGISVVATILFSIVPSGRMFGDRVSGQSRKYLANQTFENPIQVMVGMKVQGCSDKIFGSALCRNQPAFALTVMFVMDLTLFFLDTFLWYVIWNTVFSIARSFSLGLSIWTPWSDIFTRLPKRIYAKVLATSEMQARYKPKVLVSQIWNAIIISMYREHLLSIDHVQRLLYHQVPSENEGKRTLRAPMFFISQEDKGLKSEFFPPGSEAERRISFFAQSLTTSIPEPLPVDAMPTFTVLTPHYSEKILLSLREIIREEDQNARVTLLEYLKQLHPVEWDNFVRDTKILAEEANVFPSYAFANGQGNTNSSDEKVEKKKKTDDIPFYTIGFKSAAPEYTLRTRIWASLRAQTLYRTVSGFMNYSKAIKLLYRVENPEVVQLYGGNTEKLERELERMSRRKFRFVVSMQRYSKFSKEEVENTEFLLRAYPDLQIAYLEEDRERKEGGETRIFSALIDGHSEILPDGRRRPKFRVELPGNPILGDGKSDNQNHSIIFHRGEYVQLIDANQDNYLEECLKIRNVLGEFEDFHVSNQSPYSAAGAKEFTKCPVAIVGAREYIFSENIGVLGDVAAGKEQTFGTLAARSLSFIGGKLHYGHPDFLNAIFMTTRGGVSKAQKGLHLSEDIYAGMNAFGRGGRIKHTEYYQCGKGRDLGFGTILNFQTKVGTGMGEQMLSREYYYLGTQLPLDRFLTFYYAHPGFFINNMLVIFAVQCFMFTMVFLGTLNSSLTICKYNSEGQFVGSPGCYNLVPTYDWIKRCIVSIFIVFFIAFLPLFLQELTERGVISAVIRLGKQLGSCSPVFEVFSTQIQSHALLTDMTFGGARYIATGRGFATTRISFAILYSRFAGPSIYLGMRTLCLLLYVTMSLWMPAIIYFWVSVLALCLAPFIFNPHQFSFTDFIIDYREFLRWMCRGNSRSHANSWIGYCRLSRTQITGFKKKRLGLPSEKLSADVPRPGWKVILLSQILAPTFLATILSVAYMFVKSFSDPPVNALLRLAIVSLGPVAFNALTLLILFMISLFFGPALSACCTRFGSTMAAIAHVLGVVGLVGFFEFLWFIELWNISHAVLGMIATIAIQRALFKMLIACVLSREFKHDETNRAWWTGKWYGRGLGSHAWSQPVREFIVKIVEMSLFSADLLTCHFIMILLSIPLLIPFSNRLHSTMLLWLRPSKQIRPPIFSFKQRAQRRKIVASYGLLYALSIGSLIALIVLPIVFRGSLDEANCAICRSI